MQMVSAAATPARFINRRNLFAFPNRPAPQSNKETASAALAPSTCRTFASEFELTMAHVTPFR
jgi:hypothetical protein